MDGFKMCHIIQYLQNNKKVYSYETKILPKPNHFNYTYLRNNKQFIDNNFLYYANIFSNTFLGRIVFNYNNLTEKNLFIAYLISVESTKKIIDININKLTLPLNPDFYLIKIPLEKVEKLLLDKRMKEKESNFVLDCVHINKNINSNPLISTFKKSYSTKNFMTIKNKSLLNEKIYMNYDNTFNKIFGNKSVKSKYINIKRDLSSTKMYSNQNTNDKFPKLPIKIEKNLFNVSNVRIFNSTKNSLSSSNKINSDTVISDLRIKTSSQFDKNKRNMSAFNNFKSLSIKSESIYND